MNIRPVIIATLVAAASSFTASPAHADSIVFVLGNSPQSGEENILLGGDDTGSLVFGETQVTGLTVEFSSTTDTLSEPAAGQAQVVSVDGLINNLSIAVTSGYYLDIILNPFLQSPGPVSTTVTVNWVQGGSSGTSTFTYDLGNGNNFLTIFATGGTQITETTLSSSGGFLDLRQPRISGAGLDLLPVPEPTSILLFGTALSGLAVCMRRLGKSRPPRR